MRNLTCDPRTEVSGATLLSLIENMQAANITPYRRKYNLESIQRDQWYPLANFLNLLNELSSMGSQMVNFVAIGMSVAEVALTPPSKKNITLVDMIEGWNDHYQLNHRNGNIGRKIAKKIDDQHYAITLDGGVYPDDFEYGVLYGFAKRFLPQGTGFTVWYDEDVQRLDQGGTQTVIHISWE